MEDRMPNRTLSVSIATALAAGLLAGPAVAAGAAKPTHDKATNILIRAAKSTVAPKHKTTLTATLKSAKHRLAGEELWLEQRDKGTHKWGAPVDMGTTDSNGQVAVPVTPGNHKGTKEQYRVVFQGDTGYRASHSSLITITVSPQS
jgi:hypothetical protein